MKMYMPFECNQDGHDFKTDDLLKIKAHFAEIAHSSHNNSLCARCKGPTKKMAKTTQKVPATEKGPKLFCKECLEEIKKEVEDDE